MSLRFHSLRETLLIEVDNRLPDEVGIYTAYRLPESEAVTVVPDDPATVAAALKQNGYVYNSLSAAKLHPDTEATSVGSYRRVPSQHPALPSYDEPALTTDWDPEECQYHIHLFEHKDGTAVFSHYELRPDLINPSISLRRLRTHYKPEWNEEYLQGVVDPALEPLLTPSD